MPGAADNLNTQPIDNLARKKAEDEAFIAKKNLEKHESEVAQMAIDKGFGKLDPIGEFHKKVDDFNIEKQHFEEYKTKSVKELNDARANFNFEVNKHNANVKLFIEEKQRYLNEISVRESKIKQLEDDYSASFKILSAKQAEIRNIDSEIQFKKLELEDVKQRLSLCIKTYQSLLSKIEDRKDYYYAAMMDDKLGRMSAWMKKLFKDIK